MLEKATFPLGFEMSVGELLKKKRDGAEFSKEEIQQFVKNVVSGGVDDSQIGAMLMAMYIRGLSDSETLQLTKSMVHSGDQLQWDADWQGKLVDKHSTGGVGDKISLILAPVLAACGLKVPMISGRSLEHTGGTLDKMESIPGFMVNLDQKTMQKALDYAGCFIAAATTQLCPADRVLYRVRDITSTVDYVNLITPSIISKKVASGTKFLVVDIKVGKAAFCKTVESGRILAKQLISVSAKLGVKTHVVLTHMDEPLGDAVGNALEVDEAVRCLSGKMPPAIARIVSFLGSNLLELTGYEGDAEQMISKVIEDGSAMERFRKMLLVQGVNEETARRLVQGERVLPVAKHTTQLKAHASGWVSEVDALSVGRVCQMLGACRVTGSEVIDPTVGAVVHKHVGDAVQADEVWLTLHHSTAVVPQSTVQMLQRAITITQTVGDTPDIVIEIIK